ncbi:MAG: hypothetical protein F4234_04815 [Gammaproteobacteria bacterium]|nr:hypothetical protein [Gammaproteobacteria bacterium]
MSTMIGYRRPLAFALVVVAIITILIGVTIYWLSRGSTWYGYVVGLDHRIYMVNLTEGGVVWVSRPLQVAGYPTEIDLNDDDSILYIAYGSDIPRTDYSPLLAVKLNESTDIVYKHDILDDFSGIISPAYELFYNSIAKEIYISYIYGAELMTKVDARTGQIIGSINIPIRKQYEVSPDGLMIAELYPDRARNTPNGIEQPVGIIGVNDLRTGKVVSDTEHPHNRGMFSPWGSPENNLIYVRENYSEFISRLEVFDRETGEKLAEHDFRETFSSLPNQSHVTRMPGSGDVAMSMGNSVVVFDPLTAEIKSRTRIESFPTEVVVTDKPLLQSETEHSDLSWFSF